MDEGVVLLSKCFASEYMTSVSDDIFLFSRFIVCVDARIASHPSPSTPAYLYRLL